MDIIYFTITFKNDLDILDTYTLDKMKDKHIDHMKIILTDDKFLIIKWCK